MTEDASFIFSGVILQNGNSFDSHCLDIDVSSQGSTIEEAKHNLLHEIERSFLTPAEMIPKAAKDKPAAKGPLPTGFVVEEFYFRHTLHSFDSDPVNEPCRELNAIDLKREFDSNIVSIRKA